MSLKATILSAAGVLAIVAAASIRFNFDPIATGEVALFAFGAFGVALTWKSESKPT
jgi:hypothetical protein